MAPMYHRERDGEERFHRRIGRSEGSIVRSSALPIFLFLLSLVPLAACVPSATERAISLSRQHRDEEGIRVLRAELAKHPGNLEARRILIKLLAVESDMNGVREEVGELQARLPAGDPSAHIELGHAYELTHQFDQALAAYDEAASVAPESPEGPREGGMRCARWGEVEEARPRLEEAVRRGARDAETYHVLGLVLVKLGDLAAAKAAYNAGTLADKKGAENWLGLATVAVIEGDGSAALSAYDQILARKPSFGAAELGRAWALAKLGRREEALRALDHAEELGAPRANVLKQRAVLDAPVHVPGPE
jgi:tetratricopeptide (TPR) repeat protein